MRVGILTSGGDSPGMNAVIVGAQLEASAQSVELVGIANGFAGLAERGLESLPTRARASLVGRGGTVLGTSRHCDLRSAADLERCRAAIEELSLDGLVVAGGSGTRQGALRLRHGRTRAVAFVPATIDNDVEQTDLTIGFDSAVNFGLRVIDDLRMTAEALPNRAFLVEVLGGSCGNIARAIAAATPVDALLVSEERRSVASVAEDVGRAVREGYALIVMNEGYGHAEEVASEIGELLEIRVRPTILGHSQRGTTPSALDRTLGLRAGRLAVQEVVAGRGGEVTISGLRTDIGRVQGAAT